ncbi:MAG: biotin--[acetyl-CoA-carboxylase] ligase [Vulcanimicrobiaceae bacterium]
MTDPFAKTRNALYGTVFQHIQFHPMTQSTNDDAVKFLGHAQAAGLTIATNFQTHGVGRKGRAWVAPMGGSLLFSTILPVTFEPADLWTVPFWAGICVQAALKFHNIQATLQWPNDILLNGRKLGGILCVSRGQGARAWVACGVGINVDKADDPKYQELDPKPAFIREASKIERADLRSTLLQPYARMMTLIEKPTLVARRWEDASQLTGTPDRVLIDGETDPIEGTAVRIAHHGELILNLEGRLRHITMADARIIRSPG